jgi:hypothetical protein
MRRSIAVAAVSLVFTALPATGALAANPHTTSGASGQPNQDCEALGVDHAGFDTGGFANAQSHYADPSILPPTANQTHTVSQYDVACFQQASR